jgi:hypothetical protein
MRTVQLRRTIVLAVLVAAASSGRNQIARGDILVSTYDDSSVERFDETTFAPASGSIPSGANGLMVAQGVAVGPDHTIYVSSTFTGSVQRYDVAGNFLGAFSNAALAAPSTLQFGPNGNLFVADFGTSTVLEFEPSGSFVGTAATVASAPGGFTWAPDGDIIVSELFGPITKFHNGAAVAELVAASMTLTPAGLLALGDGGFLIANLYGSNIMRYDAGDEMVHVFASVEHPIAPPGPFPDPMFLSNGPAALVVDGESLLVVVSGPDHDHSGQIQRFDLSSGDYLETIIDGLGAPTALAFIPSVPEPSTWALAAIGSAGVAFAFRRRGRRAARLRAKAAQFRDE